MFGAAGEIGMPEHVAGAVDAGALAVPHAEHAIELAFAAQLGLLRAPERGGGKVFIQAALELDVGVGELAPGAHELQVEPAERGAAIAGHIAGGIEAGAPVALLLHQAHADDGLIAGHENRAFGQVVFVIQIDVPKAHNALLRDSRLAAPSCGEPVPTSPDCALMCIPDTNIASDRLSLTRQRDWRICQQC